jgi:hypothetical protein
MPFGFALEAARQGKKIARKGWNGKGMWIQAQFSDEHSKMTLPYLYIEYPKGSPAYPDGSRVRGLLHKLICLPMTGLSWSNRTLAWLEKRRARKVRNGSGKKFEIRNQRRFWYGL